MKIAAIISVNVYIIDGAYCRIGKISNTVKDIVKSLI
jgi:hypothetical protein